MVGSFVVNGVTLVRSSEDGLFYPESEVSVKIDDMSIYFDGHVVAGVKNGELLDIKVVLGKDDIYTDSFSTFANECKLHGYYRSITQEKFEGLLIV